MSVQGARRRDVPQYPPIALREAVVNAVVHADYSQAGSPIRVAIFDDRIEIENPGLLPFGLTLEDIRSGISKLRNRVIGRVFHELGLIEQWGSGIERMVRACHGLGLDEPLLEEIGTHFRLTIHAKPRTPRKPAGGTSGRILKLLADDSARSTSAIAETLGLTKRTIRTHLQRLVERGLVVEVGEGPNDPRRVYRRVRE
jgi:predicted HTH transcriptional regulator